jgi:hypothetical protein
MVSAVLITPPARSQAAGREDGPSPEDLVEDLREADSFARGPLLQQITERGEPAVSALTEVVNTWRQAGDVNFVTGCMLVLGEIGEPARGATDALMEGLTASSARIRYASARALGGIWAGADNGEERVKNINAALLSATYADAYEGRGAEAYAPIMALIRINDIPIDQGGAATLSSVPLASLRSQVGRYMSQNSEALPAFEDQPWELLMAALLRRPRSQMGRQAKQTLVRRKPLAAIESITRTLRRGRVKPGSNRWAELADVLTGISGVKIERDPEGVAAEVVTDWTNRWLEALRGRTAEQYRTYSLHRLERIIGRAKVDPSPEVLNAVETMKSVLLHQLESPQQLPENISPEVRDLLEHPLELKQEFAEAVTFFRKNQQAHRRLQSAKKMQRVVDRPEGKRVARQFLEQLVQFARQEERRQILVSLARLLRNITGVPIVFGEQSREERSRTIDKWLEKVRQQEENREGEEG